MKNLSLEEKAKRYDEAIEKAEKWHNAPNVDKIPTFGNRIIEDIFPELYEWDANKKELVEQMTDKKHKQYMLEHQDETIYDMSFEEAQDFISKRGFDIPWNDGDVMVDERKLTQTVANVLKWADRHPLMLPYKKK